MTTITRELIDAGRTSSGGWTATQINLLGMQWPPAKGWQEKVIGREISQEDADRFLGLRTRSMKRIEPAPPGRRTPRARPTLRLNDVFESDYTRELRLKGLGAIRVWGRHSIGDHLPEALDDLLRYWERSHNVSPEQGRAAFEAGLADKRNGVRCMCFRCEAGGNRIPDRERQRWEYADSRTRALIAAGLAEPRARQQVLEEMDRGAAV